MTADGKIFGIRREELPFSLLMCAYFFLVITSFWVLKPIKKSLFIDFYKTSSGFHLFGWEMHGSQAELLAKVLNMLVAAGAVAVFSYISRTLRRQNLTYVFSIVFIMSYFLYSNLLGHPDGPTVWSFYLFGDLYSTVMVATFFAFLNDSVTPDAAKRTYGLIGFGGVAGGAFGALSVNQLVDQISNQSWMFVLAGITLVIIALAAAAGRIANRRQPVPVASKEPAPQKSNVAFEGARLVFKSRYLLAIVAIVGLYEMVSTIMDFQFTSSVEHYVAGSTREHFSAVFAITNFTAMFVQLFLTSYIMTRFGMTIALLVLPAAAFAGSSTFLLAPGLLTGSALNTVDNAFAYSINQSSKESLYVPTSRDEKYKAKAFIDMFVQRFAKSLAVGLSLLLTAIFSNFSMIRWLSLLSIAILILWMFAARYAGNRFEQMAKTEEKVA